jgi:hypothetical protein
MIPTPRGFLTDYPSAPRADLPGRPAPVQERRLDALLPGQIDSSLAERATKGSVRATRGGPRASLRPACNPKRSFVRSANTKEPRPISARSGNARAAELPIAKENRQCLCMFLLAVATKQKLRGHGPWHARPHSRIPRWVGRSSGPSALMQRPVATARIERTQLPRANGASSSRGLRSSRPRWTRSWMGGNRISCRSPQRN